MTTDDDLLARARSRVFDFKQGAQLLPRDMVLIRDLADALRARDSELAAAREYRDRWQQAAVTDRDALTDAATELAAARAAQQGAIAALKAEVTHLRGLHDFYENRLADRLQSIVADMVSVASAASTEEPR